VLSCSCVLQYNFMFRVQYASFVLNPDTFGIESNGIACEFQCFCGIGVSFRTINRYVLIFWYPFHHTYHEDAFLGNLLNRMNWKLANDMEPFGHGNKRHATGQAALRKALRRDREVVRPSVNSNRAHRVPTLPET